MVDEDLGEATIVYEHPDEGTVETTVDNEHVAYFQDHWILKTGEDDRGRDLVRRIPHDRVYYVERTVQQFEEEVRTVRDQVQSLADEVRSKLGGGIGGGLGGGRGERGGPSGSDEPVHHIDIESGDDEDDEADEDDESQ